MLNQLQATLQMALVHAPLLIVYLIGFALAIGKRHLSQRYTYAAIGFTILFFETIFSRFIMQFLIQYLIDYTAVQIGAILSFYSFITICIQAIGVIFILLALFKQDRRTE